MVGMSTPDSTANNEIASAFVEQHQSEVIGVLHGWDRLRLQGTLRSLYYLRKHALYSGIASYRGQDA